MHLIVLFFISFIFITLLSSIFVYFFDKKIGYFVPLSFSIIGLTYYFVGLVFGSFSVVKYLLIIYSIIGVYFFIRCIINGKSKNIFTYGLLFLLVTFCFFFLYCYKYNIAYFDEFYHWSPMVRSMFINNKFYSVCQGSGAHIEYPPFISLLELFFCRIYGLFSESVSSIGMHIVTLSFFVVPYIDIYDLKIKKSFYIFIYVFMCILLFAQVVPFRSIMIDVTLSFIAAFPLLLLLSNSVETKFGKVYYGIALGCLLLTKQLGIVFYFINLITYFVIHFKRKDIKIIVKDLLIIVAISLIIYLPWLVYIYSLGIGSSGQFSVLSMLTKIIKLNFTNDQIKTFSSIIKAFFVGNMLNSKLYISCFIFYIFICILCFLFNRNDKTKTKKYLFLIIISIVIFYFFLSVVYCFAMEEHEMESLNSFFRYSASLNIFLLFFFLLINRENISIIFSTVVLITLLIVNIPNYEHIVPRVFINEKVGDETSSEAKECSNYIVSYIDKNASILIISDYTFAEYRFNYMTMYERKISSSAIFNENSTNLNIFKSDDLIQEVKKYDYVIIAMEDSDNFSYINNYFINRGCNTDIYNYIVYRVDEIDNELSLYMMT